MLFRSFALACTVCLLSLTHVVAQDVDVYFITGQSNAGNFAKEAGTGMDDLGFNFHFARTNDTFNDFPNHTAVEQNFTLSSVDGSLATSILASQLRREGRDVAIFTFARVGAGLNLNTTSEGDPWIWYPGSDPANGQTFEDSLYANSVDWFNSRLQELEEQGLTPSVEGLFWLQGEKDARLGKIDPTAGGQQDHLLYADNFDNLTTRFREDFGEDLPIVATQIREFPDSEFDTEDIINQALFQAAEDDPLTGFVMTNDLEFRDANNVHLSNNEESINLDPTSTSGLAALAPIWAAEIQRVQAVPEPSSLTLLLVGSIAAVSRRSRKSR